MGIISLKRVTSFLCILLLGVLLMTPLTGKAQQNNPLDAAKTYKVYYDAPSAAKIKKMQQYDVMIIEPVFYTPAQIKEIKKYGTKVYGYINTMEADNWNVDLMKKLNESDFFHRDGQRIHYAEWDSYLTDITSAHYQTVLMQEIEKQIVVKGLDGVFLDTVGNIDNEHSGQPQILEQQQVGMTKFLKSVKVKHPALSLIQNWGFGTLKYHTYPYVDGIMWENFNYSSVANDQWSKDRMADLQKLSQTQDIKTLTISSVQGAKSAAYAQKNGFLHLKSNVDLDYNKF